MHPFGRNTFASTKRWVEHSVNYFITVGGSCQCDVGRNQCLGTKTQALHIRILHCSPRVSFRMLLFKLGNTKIADVIRLIGKWNRTGNESSVGCLNRLTQIGVWSRIKQNCAWTSIIFPHIYFINSFGSVFRYGCGVRDSVGQPLMVSFVNVSCLPLWYLLIYLENYARTILIFSLFNFKRSFTGSLVWDHWQLEEPTIGIPLQDFPEQLLQLS